MKRSGLFSQAGWSLVGQGSYYGLQWLNMIVLAHLSGPQAVGLYTLGLAIANPVMAVAGLMFRLVYITDQKNRWSFDDYNKVRWVSLPLGAFAIAFIGLGLGYRDLALIVIMIAASWKTAESLSDINYAIPHRRGDMRAIALSMIIRAALSSIVLALMLKISGRLDFALAVFSLAWWFCYLVLDRRFEKDAEIKEGDASKSELVHFALPMALSAAVIYLTFSIPRVVLDQYENAATLGVFAAISHLLLIGAMIVNSLGSAITPRLSRYFAANDMAGYYREIKLALTAAIVISLGFIATAHLGGEFLVTLIYGKEIGREANLIQMMSLTSLPVYIGSLLGFIPPALQAYRFHLVINIITVVGTSVTAFLLIPVFGALGAIYAIMVQGLLQLLNALILFKRPEPTALDLEKSPLPNTI